MERILSYRIRRCAYRARTKAEKIAAKDGFESNLRGFCARGAAILYSELKKSGLPSVIYYAPGHVYVWCCGYYADITATQFGLSKTIVRSERTIEVLRRKVRIGFWSKNMAAEYFDHPSKLRKWQLNSSWNPDNGIVLVTDYQLKSSWSIVSGLHRRINEVNEVISKNLKRYVETIRNFRHKHIGFHGGTLQEGSK
jgi:hypothetical protein